MTKAKTKPIPEPRRFDLADSLLKIPDACRVTGIPRSSFYEMIAAGKIKTVKLGRRTRVKGAELIRFMAAL